MADETPVYAVIGQGDTAFRAFINIPALTAGHQFMSPSPVEEENALLTPIYIRLKLTPEEGADAAVVACAKLLFQIYNSDFG